MRKFECEGKFEERTINFFLVRQFECGMNVRKLFLDKLETMQKERGQNTSGRDRLVFFFFSIKKESMSFVKYTQYIVLKFRYINQLG